MMTFAEVIVHTVAGYLKELEKKTTSLVVIKVNDAGGVRNSSDISKGNFAAQRPASKKVNYLCGRIIFPLAFLIFTASYAGIAALYINTSQHHLLHDLRPDCPPMH